MDWGARLSEKQIDRLCISAIICLFLARFFKTIFLEQSISRIFLLAHWDSLFYHLRSGQSLSMDPSLVQLFIPYNCFVADYWHHGLPLWNQLSGFGMPLIADPQAMVFSPLHAAYILFTGLHTREIILVFKILLGAISTYFLCRELKLDFVGALIAALLFAFCPWLQWQLELMGRGSNFVPFVFFFFARLAKKDSFKNIVLASIAAATDILSSHPEIAFITIIFASIFTCILTDYYQSERSLMSSLKTSTARIALTALITFALCAPMFIPFLEYVRNSDSYKLEVIASSGLPWQAVFANYLFPFQSAKGSIFFGPLSILGTAASLFFFKYLNSIAKPLIICLAISIIAVIRPFPFDWLFKIPPFCMTFPTYWLPEYCLFIAIVSGLGCSYLIKNSLSNKSLRTILFLTAVLVLFLMPLLYVPWHASCDALIFDNTFELPKFNFKVWLFNTICAVIALLALTSTFNKARYWKIIGASFFVGIGLLNLFITSFSALPVRPNFQYPKTLPLNLNSTRLGISDRILSIGDHLLRPNTNLIYKLPLLQTANPIFPKGFIEFSKTCGAQTDQYTQVFPPLVSPLLKLAGVNTIISEQPILDASVLNIPISDSSLSHKKENKDQFTAPHTSNKKSAILPLQVKYTNSITLSNLKLLYDAKSHALFLIATALTNAQNNSSYHLCLSIEDNQETSVSYTEPVLINTSDLPQTVMASALIPKELKHWSVSIRTMQDKDSSFLHPEQVTRGTVRSNNSWLITTCDKSNYITEINNDRFKLIAQQGSILKYKDTTAFNRHFFVDKIVWRPNRQEALNYLKTHPNELGTIAVLEEEQQEQFVNVLKTIPSIKLANFNLSAISFDTSGTVKRSELPNDKFPYLTNISLLVETKAPSFLVVSDIYYPGWQVYIDEQKSQIFRADSLFRGVLIPAGKHIVKFSYQPVTVILGFLLFGLTLTALLIIGLIKKINAKPKSWF